MAMGKLVFVYAGDPNDGRISSPYSITTNLYNYFINRGLKVEYHKWDSYDDVELSRDDVVIGHPHYDPNTIIQKIFRQPKQCKARCTIHPFHHQRVEDNFPFDYITKQADKVFAITGNYWYDTIGDTPFAHWKEKMVRLDMAVNSAAWPHRKTTFNSPSCRGIVYVGSNMPQKNVGMLAAIAGKMRDVRFDWYGGDGDAPLAKLPNVHVEGWADFTSEKIANICYRNDLFVNVSISDANPTTLLEFCLASGIIPICTETSGYWKDDCFINIPHDVDKAVIIIRDWLNRPSKELIAKSAANRLVCDERYTWNKFCETIWAGLEPLL
jgi:hypothetical protein